ncbi:MAG: fused MFS/spermidine synthase [Bryobacteraceae bacterium]
MRPSLVLIGFTAVVAQIVLMRELIVVSSGNEIALGLMLAAWLLWTALGSLLAPRNTDAGRQMAVLQMLIAAVLPLSIAAVRWSRLAFHAMPGEILGPGAVLLTALSTLSVICVLCGALFSSGVRCYASSTAQTTAQAAGSVYLMETLGAGLGGVSAALIFLGPASSMQVAFLVAWLNLIAAGTLLRPGWFRRPAVAAGLVLLPLAAYPAFSALETRSLERLWQGFQVVAARNSRYGNLVVVKTEETQTLYENGLPSFNVPDAAAAEEAVHYALLEHPAPRNLLLIGGGLNGSLMQAFQHPTLQSADYVELDPAILELARKHFPEQWRLIAADARIHIHPIDGRLFVKKSGTMYDVIIVNLADPQTAQLNRFYTEEFFREAAGRLNAGGVLSFQLTAAEDYISPELAAFLRCIQATLGEVFPAVVAMPGPSVHFFAAQTQGALTLDPQQLIARLQARHLRTQYVREYFLPFRLSADRRADLEAQLQARPGTPINHDFAPIAYFFDVALWGSRFRSIYLRLFQAAAGTSFRWLAIVTFLLSAVLAAAGYLRRAVAGTCVASMGFTMIGLEILLLLGFQAVYGYVYQQLALVTASFMAGMALGSWLALRARRGPGLAALQCLAAVAPILICLGMPLTPPILFTLLAVLCGALGGYQFPVASRISAAGAPGMLYALDLAGACIGAILFSAWLIPVFGFERTALLMALAGLPPAIAARARRRPAP